jgi:hypothetical protein
VSPLSTAIYNSSRSSSFVYQSEEVSGYSLSNEANTAVKLIQYADDSTLFLKNEYEIPAAIDIINRFSKVAGMQLHLKKCEGLWIGRDKGRQINCSLYGIKWPQTPIKFLGIYVGYDDSECANLNWQMNIEKLNQTLDTWKKHDLTLFGKVTIIQSLAISPILY